MIGSICVIVRRPMGEELSAMGIRTAWATFAAAIDSNLLFIDDGVYNALGNKGYNTSMIKDYLAEGGKVYCLEKSIAERGLLEENLVDGIEIVSDEDVAEIIEEAESSAIF